MGVCFAQHDYERLPIGVPVSPRWLRDQGDGRTLTPSLIVASDPKSQPAC
jgi:hypothetical protein